MRMRVNRSDVTAGLPVDLDKLKQYLRVDFADDDTMIEGIASAVAAQVEHFAQIALLMQTIRVSVFQPDKGEYLDLPVGPVADDAEVTVNINGIPFSDFTFAGGNRPCLFWGAGWPWLAANYITITYRAGFGEEAEAIPKDLAQAIMDQAALMYDAPSPMAGDALTLSPHMARIAARYRGVSA